MGIACGFLAFSSLSGLGAQVADLVITAKVVLEDGSPLKTAPLISLYVPGAEDMCTGQELFLGGTLRLRVPRVMIQGEPQVTCHISITLAGYRKFTGLVQDGTVITLRRIGPNEGSAVSMVSLSAPADAKKEYEAGESAASKKKWEKAEEHFRAAVSSYPQYALAWSELGQALVEQGRIDEAKDAFHKARTADPQYVKPVVQMAAVSGAQEHWEDEMRISLEALKMHPVEFPAAYYYHAEATYHLGTVEDAERLTREALQLDPGGTFPEPLVLLGKIFEKQGNSHDAVIEYKNYLKVAPHGVKAEEAKEGLARLKRGN